jgi:hypothetical protein
MGQRWTLNLPGQPPTRRCVLHCRVFLQPPVIIGAQCVAVLCVCGWGGGFGRGPTHCQAASQDTVCLTFVDANEGCVSISFSKTASVHDVKSKLAVGTAATIATHVRLHVYAVAVRGGPSSPPFLHMSACFESNTLRDAEAPGSCVRTHKGASPVSCAVGE